MVKHRVITYGLLTVGVALCLGYAWPDLVGRVAYAVEKGQACAAREELKVAKDFSIAFQEVTKAVKPSVVNVKSIRKIDGRQGIGNSPLDDEFFERFFGNRLRRAPQNKPFVQRGLGTGVIVTEDGYIITNNHVVANATEVKVTLSDNRTFDAEVIGTDEKTDVAIIKIDAPDLLPATLGDSEKTNVGEWVLAIGNPFGLTATVTAGIISAEGRSNVGVADYEDFLQTDAAINPGNSGGPLVNLNGEVIGINTAIASRSGGYQGIGFAIPIDMVKQVMNAIIEDGKVVRGFLGVMIQDLSPELAQSFDFDGTHGVLIGDVVDDSPAAQAGLVAGDIVTEVNGKAVEDSNELRNRVAAIKPNTTIKLKIFRDGKDQTVSVTVGELESAGFALGSPMPQENLGMKVQGITPAIVRQFRLNPEDDGVIVTQVEPGSPAEEAGIRPGDLIIQIGTGKIHDMQTFRKAMSEADLEAGVRLRIKTAGVQRFVILKD